MNINFNLLLKKITSKIENKSINIQGLNKIEINGKEFCKIFY